MNECLLALCLALGVPDARLATLPSDGGPAATRVVLAAAGDTVPRRTTRPPRRAEPGDRVFGEDKWKHFFTSFIITSLGASGARAAGLERGLSLGVGAGLSMGAGAAKEVFDFRNPQVGTPSLLDLAWDALGTGAGVVVVAQALDD